MKLRNTVFMTAILAVVLASVAIPMTASATTTQPSQTSAPQPTGWPHDYDVSGSNIQAVGNDKIATIYCNNPSSTANAMTFDANSGTSDIRTYMPSFSTSRANCPDDGGSDASAGYAVDNDGGMYTDDQLSDGTWQIEKYKDGSQIWVENLPTSTTNCYYYSPYTDYKLIMQSMSIGPDGNLYGLLRFDGTPSACGFWLVGYNSQTGGALFSPVQVTTLAFTGGIIPRLWTYASDMLVYSSDGTVHEYGYDGVENTSKEFTLTVPSGTYLTQVLADPSEGVYGVFAPDPYTTGYAVVTYHDASGTSSPVDTPFSDASSLPLFVVGGNEELVAWKYGYLYHIDIPDNTYTADFINLPSGYTSQGVLGYMEDTDGTGVLVRQVWTGSSYSNQIRVDTVDTATNTYTNVFALSGNSSIEFDPSNNGGNYDSSAVFGNYLYVPVCYMDGCSGSVDRTLYKVELTGVGDIVKSANAQHDDYVTNYAALGDSYSSGEGSFNYDLPGGSCHRSSDSYPYYVAERVSGLSVPDFVACSGAVTDGLFNTSTVTTSEGPQITSALTTDTQAVTLTIGGNDLGFKDVLGACVTYISHTGYGCSSDSSVTGALDGRLEALEGTTDSTEPSGDEIHSYTSIFAAIHAAAPNATIYIAGYPHLFGSSSTDYDSTTDTGTGGYKCTLHSSPDISIGYTDAQWLNDETDALNGAISSAAAAAPSGEHVNYVSPSTFNGHGLCDSGTAWINGVLPFSPSDPSWSLTQSETLHPTVTGMQSGYGAAFESAMS